MKLPSNEVASMWEEQQNQHHCNWLRMYKHIRVDVCDDHMFTHTHLRTYRELEIELSWEYANTRNLYIENTIAFSYA